MIPLAPHPSGRHQPKKEKDKPRLEAIARRQPEDRIDFQKTRAKSAALEDIAVTPLLPAPPPRPPPDRQRLFLPRLRGDQTGDGQKNPAQRLNVAEGQPEKIRSGRKIIGQRRSPQKNRAEPEHRPM